MKKTLFIAGAMLFGASVMPALAHDEYGNPNYYHWQDHAEHRDYHNDLREAHRRAHEEGFENEAEHRAYHRYLRQQHEDFHEDHPNTRHDHDRWYRRWWWNR